MAGRMASSPTTSNSLSEIPWIERSIFVFNNACLLFVGDFGRGDRTMRDD